MCIDYIIASTGCHAPELIAATKFKITKINFGGLFGLSTKINTHENYLLYGIYHVCAHHGRQTGWGLSEGRDNCVFNVCNDSNCVGPSGKF